MSVCHLVSFLGMWTTVKWFIVFCKKSLEISSDVKFHEIFWREIFHEIFHEIFLKYFKNFTMFFFFRQYTLTHLILPVKGKYLLLCMNITMYFLLTSYILITFWKVLNHFIMKIINFMKYFKWVLKYFKISLKFLYISKWNISSCIPRDKHWRKSHITKTWTIRPRPNVTANSRSNSLELSPCCPLWSSVRHRHVSDSYWRRSTFLRVATH